MPTLSPERASLP